MRRYGAAIGRGLFPEDLKVALPTHHHLAPVPRELGNRQDVSIYRGDLGTQINGNG